MRHMSCADLVPGCHAIFRGETDNVIALQYVVHLHLHHRDWPVDVADLLDAITDTAEEDAPPPS